MRADSKFNLKAAAWVNVDHTVISRGGALGMTLTFTSARPDIATAPKSASALLKSRVHMTPDEMKSLAFRMLRALANDGDDFHHFAALLAAEAETFKPADHHIGF